MFEFRHTDHWHWAASGIEIFGIFCGTLQCLLCVLSLWYICRSSIAQTWVPVLLSCEVLAGFQLHRNKDSALGASACTPAVDSDLSRGKQSQTHTLTCCHTGTLSHTHTHTHTHTEEHWHTSYIQMCANTTESRCVQVFQKEQMCPSVPNSLLTWKLI